MRRLYLQIYLAVIAVIIVVTLAAALLWRNVVDQGPPDRPGRAMAELVASNLPAADEPLEAQRAALERMRGRGPRDLALYSRDGKLIAAVGNPVPPPEINRAESGWVGRRGPGGTAAWAIALPDGRWLVVRRGRPRDFGPPVLGFAALLALLAVGVAAAAYPVVRRITRRIERLQLGVEALGAGDLSARVPIEGRDEVAGLARSFNESAARIERLLQAHRGLLANASHELRSPLARIQVGIELAKKDMRPDLVNELERSVAELDQLVEEILLASRLDAVPANDAHDEVDLLALAAEEAARTGAALEGEATTIIGDARLLRRLIRNLLENARRHGAGTAVDISVRHINPGGTEIRVCDGGPGVPAAERERIFEPFYRPSSGTREGSGGSGGYGLGLSLVRTIAQRHGGDVSYAAGSLGGACFVVNFPNR